MDIQEEITLILNQFTYPHTSQQQSAVLIALADLGGTVRGSANKNQVIIQIFNYLITNCKEFLKSRPTYATVAYKKAEEFIDDPNANEELISVCHRFMDFIREIDCEGDIKEPSYD